MNLSGLGYPDQRRVPMGWQWPKGIKQLERPRWPQSEQLYQLAQAVPTLDLQFAVTRSLVDNISGRNLITFTRASLATYVDRDGILKTAATNVPRFDHNPITGESLGLLVEEQRTNLLLNSATLATQSATVTAVAYTLSFYGTGTVTLSGASTAGPAVGSGAFSTRTTLTFTPTAGSLTLTVSGSVTSAQLEAGSFATTYIPTTTAAATRAADVATITGEPFSSWYRQNEETLFAESQLPAGSATNTSSRTIIDLTDGSTNNRLSVRAITSATTADQLTIRSSSATTAQFASSGSAVGTTARKFAAAVKIDDFATWATGASTAASDTSGAMPIGINQVNIGVATGGTEVLSGTIRRLTYWPTRLPNTALQRITQ